MTSTTAQQQARLLLPALATTALLVTGSLPAHATQPTASPPTIDPHARGLELPAGHTLAPARIRHLAITRRSLTQVTTAHTGGTPRPQPFKAQQQPSPESTPPTATSSTAPSRSSSASPHASATARPAQPKTNRLSWTTLLAAATLLTALLLTLRTPTRHLHRHRPDRKTTTPVPTSAPTAQASTARTAEPSTLCRLDAALRTLADHSDHQQAPQLRAARITTRSLQVLPHQSGPQPPAPFTTTADGWWELPSDAELPASDRTHDGPAPYPGLVTIGTTHHDGEEDDGLLLLDLTHLPALLLDGTPTHITEVCASLALEAASSPWGGEIQITTIGFGQDLPQALPDCPITHQPDPAHALKDLSQQLLEAHQRPEPGCRPHLLLCTTPIEPDTARQFADLLSTTPTPLTLIAPLSAAAHFPTAATLNASLPAPQPLDHVGLDITLQRLQYTAYQQITAALSPSRQLDRDAEGPRREASTTLDATAPPEADPAQQAVTADPDENSDTAAPKSASAGGGETFWALRAALTDAPSVRSSPTQAGHQSPQDDQPATGHQPPRRGATTPRHSPTQQQDRDGHDPSAPQIRVLGPIEVDGVDPTGHGPRIAQLAALLYFRPGRSADELCHAMDPHTPWTHATLNARLQGLRRALGNDPTGNPYVPRRSSGEDPYQLSPAIRCDWTTFKDLTERALPQGPAGLPDLEQALSLVRGRPFGSRPLPWAEPYQQEMITSIVDVAHTVASHRTQTASHHNLSAARQAIATGLDVDPGAERLYRGWMLIEAAAGNRSGIHTAITRVQQVNAALGCDIEPETEQLIQNLLNTASPKQVRAS